jgi:RHS repeat-associated protein
LTLKNGLVESRQYNDRLQVQQIQAGNLLTLTYSYCLNGNCGQNNGNVQQQTIAIPGSLSAYQYFSYDDVNRLTVASEFSSPQSAPQCATSGPQWCETYNYGQWGNRTIVAPRTTSASALEPAAFDTSTNHMTTGGMGGTFQYGDNRGNLTEDAIATTVGALPATYAYDAENRLIAYCPQGGTCTTATAGATVYTYEGGGNRIAKSSSSGTVIYVHDAAGELMAEYGGTASLGLQYLTGDALGSTRLITDASGNVLERRDYYPFGEQILATTSNGRACAVPANCPALAGYSQDVGVTPQFTGKERDTETGLDFFGARYFSGAQGRFTSPDPMTYPRESHFGEQGFLAEPQRWNKYSYALNNPLRNIDPDGYETQATLDPKAVQEAGDTIGDVIVGSGKGLWNALAGTANLVNNFINAESRAFTGRDLVSTVPEAQYDNTTQALAGIVAPILIAIPEMGVETGSGNAAAAGVRRGGETADTIAGRQAHAEFAAKVKQKPGWQSEPSLTDPATGKTVKPDAVSRAGRPVELKPNTPSGRAAGRRQLPKYERATGKQGRVVYHNKKDPNAQN